MAKKSTPVVQTKVDPKRETTIKNRIARLEKHIKNFPNDLLAQAALKREKPARKTPKVKGSYPKPVVRITECTPRPTGKRDKAGKPIMKNGSGFVSSKHTEGTVIPVPFIK